MDQPRRGERLVMLTADEVRDLVSANYRPINEQTIGELWDSIKEGGLIEPITVRKTSEGTLRIVKGDHRVETIRRLIRAYPHLAIQVQAIVKHGDSEPSDAVQQVLSNFSRRDGVIDRAGGYAFLRDSGKSVKQIGELTGKDRPNIEAHLHFHSLYSRHRDLIASKIATMTDTAWYRLGYRFAKDPELNVSEAIEKASYKPRTRQITSKPTAEATLTAAGIDSKEAKRLAGVLKKAGLIRL